MAEHDQQGRPASLPAASGPADRPDGRSYGRLAAWGALVPAVAFLGLTAVRVVRQPKLNFDEHIFLDVGRHILDTGLPMRAYGFRTPSLFFDHTPLYVYLVAALTAIGGPTELIIRSTTLVFGLLTVLLVYRIGLEQRGMGSALVGSMLVALNPFFATYSWFIRMEVPLCFFLVLGLYLLIHERFLLAGLAIAVAVMLKEIALAFWLVAVGYVFFRRGIRAASRVGVPTVVALVAWLAYAAWIGEGQLRYTINRWFGSTVGADIADKRLHIGLYTWAQTVVGQVIGPVLIFAGGAAAGLAAVWRRPIPPIVIVPIAYIVIAIIASFLIRLKEPRFLIAVIPMAALAIALLVDWDDVWAALRRPRDPGLRTDDDDAGRVPVEGGLA